MITAAGILFKGPGDQVLFLKRSANADHPGEWCFPGGRRETGETLEACAEREAIEEVGSIPEGVREEWTRQITPTGIPAIVPGDASSAEVDFTTFIQNVDECFIPVLNDEHTGWAWASFVHVTRRCRMGC